ncbi:UDP-N-acetyl glucosamine 2-epimerase [Clostridium zeae]|uniref:UDP-N-acetyl glucosamine 2-epimerase n=1 Tax=Clostridium zeae TaxID=2759022 RepID=A0ABQ1EFY8_9CLOT|nr:UDP-N-acetylglucosamine 2-epimerase [Clostridium zeae]GFZ33724.1 UDP-N-acetyl glucosamine 2-epimerase [Clostridium zeae]
MRKIAVVTGTRAEYGLLKNIMLKIDQDEELELALVVTGTHLSEKYGKTVDEIINDGFDISKSVDILMEDTDSKIKTAKEMAKALDKLTDIFNEVAPDLLLILGDRYEVFSAAAAAMAMNIPIAHISGGEITEGAMDEQIRHSITKMAHIHFPGAKVYADNIKAMGEESWRIFNVGDPGIENIKLTKLMSQEELEKQLGVCVDEDTILITYHPVTLEINQVDEQISNLIEALSQIDKKMIITYPNADNGGDIIIEAIEEFKDKYPDKVFLHKNLGSLRYLSVMNLCGAIVGNSSSALVEAPFMKKPVVNIGNRQKGRLKASNIIDTTYDSVDILMAINQCFSNEFAKIVEDTRSLYGEGNTSDEIVTILKTIELGENLIKKKLRWS